MQSPTVPDQQSDTPTPAAADELHLALHRYFGFDQFLQGQEEAIRSILAGRDAVVIMPTGSGKSLCYQLSALLLPGVTLVISPLIALMKDQVDRLAQRGLPATYVNSSLSADTMRRRLAAAQSGRYKLVYVSPERFRNQRFREALSHIDVAMLAVDEAHCISQWGHDFRPDYLRLGEVVAALPEARVMALTATATMEVRRDIAQQLWAGGSRPEPDVYVHGFARPNLHLAVTRTASHEEKLARIAWTLERYPTGIVYCATRGQVERVHTYLRDMGYSCVAYHAGLADAQRRAVQERFMGGEVPVVVATNAFGMGVDRADLRFVIHWDLPGSIEAYYQETGRAGRDGQPAHCELLYNYADVQKQEFFLAGANPTPEQVTAVWQVVRQRCRQGPVLERWIHTPAVANEIAARTALYVLEEVGLVERALDPAGRGFTVALIAGADERRLQRHFPRLEAKRLLDEGKLKALLRYVNSSECRHAHILRYFGERTAGSSCGACDFCLSSERTGLRSPSDGEWVLLQKVLSCVARMRGRFGQRRVAQVLTGSQDDAVVQRGLDKLSTYALLQDRSETYVRRVLDELIRDGSVQVSGGDYPTVDLTPRGWAVMGRKDDIEIMWPEEPSRRRRGSQPRARRTAPSPAAASDAGVVAGVLARLTAWRRDEARSRGVPAYTVLNNATLEAISTRRPRTLPELAAVPGIGPARLQRYGAAILALVADDFTPE